MNYIHNIIVPIIININPIQCFNSILALKNIKLIINNNTNSYTANNLKYPGCEEFSIK
jgi:hypothetical protein